VDVLDITEDLFRPQGHILLFVLRPFPGTRTFYTLICFMQIRELDVNGPDARLALATLPMGPLSPPPPAR
jgi:hypothetical protein